MRNLLKKTVITLLLATTLLSNIHNFLDLDHGLSTLSDDYYIEDCLL